MIRTVIGVDPGLTTGVARLDLDAWRVPSLAQVTPELVLDVVEMLLGAQDPADVLLAVEAFVVGPRAARSSTPAGGRTARELIAALHALPVRAIGRTAAAVKPWATDRRLEKAGLLVKGMPHAADAGRHALYAAVNDGGLPDPLSRKAAAR